jgi:two-component system response regulator AtoC
MDRVQTLIVDDDEDVLDAVQCKLAHAGIAADTATSAERALEMMWKNLYLVVVADIHMPGLSGVELVSELKRLSPLVQVIMLTSDSTTQQVIACADRGAADFFSKTQSVDPVVQSVKDALERLDRWAGLLARHRLLKKAT